MNHKMEFSLGSDFHTSAEKAKEFAVKTGRTVEFEFNEIICIVDLNTNLEWLWKDYLNAHRMEWKQITGLQKYSNEVQAELDRRNKEAEERQEQQRKEWEEKDKRERKAFEEKTAGIEIELISKESWKEYHEANTDPYGKCCVDYAESWAKLMQAEMAKGRTVAECAEETSFQLGFYGITGFMYGAAVSMLAKCWKYGEELRKWHNKDYKYEGEGVVNPAVLTIGNS